MATGLLLGVLLLISCICFAEQGPVGDQELAKPRCPRGWNLFDSRCFKFYSQRVSWWGAEDLCVSVGAHLASIHSRRENQFVSGLGENTRTWIGGQNAFELVTGIGVPRLPRPFYFWSDASGMDYTQWAAGKPSRNSGEDCMEINFQGPDWNNAGCERLSPFICAKEA